MACLPLIKKSSILLFALFACNSTCLAVIVADIDVVDSPFVITRKNVSIVSGRCDPQSLKAPTEEIELSKHIRIVFFDTKLQKFTNVLGEPNPGVYYFSAPRTQTLQPYPATFSIPKWFSIKFDPSSPKPRLDLSQFVGDTRQFGRTKVIRFNNQAFDVINDSSSPKIVLKSLGLHDETRPDLTSYLYQNSEDLFPLLSSTEETYKFLNRFQNRKKERRKNLKGYFYFSEPYDLRLTRKRSEIDFHCNNNVPNSTFLKSEKGKIGELAADITMQWRNFSKKNGKYNGASDQGFDGVYCQQNALFLSDSKHYKKTPSLRTILNSDIYSKISARLENIDRLGSPLQRETAAYIREFLINHPNDSYLLAYVIIPDGHVKALVKPIRNMQMDLDPTGRIAALERRNIKLRRKGIFNIGVYHEEKREFKKAVRYYHEAADLGDNKALFILGDWYEVGKGVTKDLQQAKRFYKEAADKGYAAAQNNLGHMYYWGKGVLRDQREAKRYFLLAANQNHPDAFYNLGRLYQDKPFQKDCIDCVVYYYREAEKHGHAGAQNALSALYRDGHGVPENTKKATKLLKKAVRQGLPEAFRNLKQMAEDGDVDAQKRLADLYRNGDGVSVNTKKATQLLKKAAKQGLRKAFNNLEEMALEGDADAQKRLAELRSDDVTGPEKESAFAKRPEILEGFFPYKDPVQLISFFAFGDPNLEFTPEGMPVYRMEEENEEEYLSDEDPKGKGKEKEKIS